MDAEPVNETEETPEAITCSLEAVFNDPESAAFQLHIHNVNPAQVFALIGYLEHYARSLLIEAEMQSAAANAAKEAKEKGGLIVPVGALPRDRLPRRRN